MTVHTAVLDYGAGNLRSAQRALARAGAAVTVTDDPRAAEDADIVVVPGVGRFAQCVRRFHVAGFAALVAGRVDAGRPVLGICVGLQILYEGSDEDPAVPGLGLLPGRVRRLPAGVRVPHMGWNTVRAVRPDPLLDGVDGRQAYFVHSYAADADGDHVVAVTDHGGDFAAVVRAGAVMGTQFHPEKSGDVGARLLDNLVPAVPAPA